MRVSGEGGVCIWLLSMLDMCTRPSVPGRGFPGEEHAVCQSGETGDHRSPRERQTCRRSQYAVFVLRQNTGISELESSERGKMAL